ncbi:MAG: ABC transporter substrate-binding protein [Anaerolineales bacterium]
MDQSFDVFVSYSSKEKAIADAVVAAHEGAGIRCWYAPRDIAPGADWADSITKAIHECSIMVLVFSKEANRSQRVIDEVNYAISQEKPLLPFRVESSSPTGALSLHLSSRHWLDAFEPSWEDHIERLVKSVRINLEGASQTVQISGESAGAAVGKVSGRNPLKTVGYLAAGLVVVSLLGYFGWKNFGRTLFVQAPEVSTVTPVELTPTKSIPDSTPTEISPFTALLRGSIREDQFVLDPQSDGASMLTISLFLTLTGYDINTTQVVPRAAESWTISPDGKIYTFKLRPDIPWVQHTFRGETTQVLDENGDLRFVTAADFEYALKRTCDPRFRQGYYFGTQLIQGCRDVLDFADPENIPSEMFDAIGVEVVSDTELIIYLSDPSSLFLVITSRYGATAVPSWAMEKYGEAWMNPGLMPTNGMFVIDEWVLGESIRLVRNDLLPVDMGGEGNLQTVDLIMADDNDDAYDMWLEGEIDYAFIPDEMLSSHLDQFPGQTGQITQPYVLSVYFNTEHPLYANIHLRRALSAGFNRAEFIQEVLQGRGVAMKHFAPPGVFGAPPVDEIGVGDDIDYARAELELAGYPDCQGLPEINIYASRIDFVADEFARYWEEGLGCPEGTLNYAGFFWDHQDEVKGSDLLILGYVSEYPDADGWLGFLYCDDALFPRSCDETDALILQARTEISATARKELYQKIEEAFFGVNGTFPVVPIYSPIQLIAKPAWLEYGQSDYFEYDAFSRFSVDMDAKDAALRE